MSVSLPAHYRQGTFSFMIIEVETLISYKLQSYDQPDDSRTWMWHAINLSCSPRVIFPPKYNWISTGSLMVAVAILIVTHLSPNISLKIIIRRNFTAVSTISLMGNFCISYNRPEWRGSQLPLPRSKMGNRAYSRWKWNWWAHEKISTWRQILSPVSHEPNGGLCAVEFHPGKCERPGMFFGIPFCSSIMSSFPKILEKRRFLTPASRRSWISRWVKGETLCITDDVPVLSRACF